MAKPVVVEVCDRDDAVALARAGVGGLQFDKLDPPALAEAVAAVREVAPGLRLLAAGGITAANAADYAATGVDGLVTSWMYGGPGVDIGCGSLRGLRMRAGCPAELAWQERTEGDDR